MNFYGKFCCQCPCGDSNVEKIVFPTEIICHGAVEGCGAQALTTYTTPASPIKNGEAITFDVNGTRTGEAISHEKRTAEIVISEAGTYYVQYSGTLAPFGTECYPTVNLLTFVLNDETQSAGAAQTKFDNALQTFSVTAAALFEVKEAPVTLKVVASGGSVLYSDFTLNVFRV